MKFIIAIILAIITVGCNLEKSVESKYPGRQRALGTCHDLWDLGYKTINVPKCELHSTNPKYKLGQKLRLKSKEYDNRCNGIVVRNYDWNPVKNWGVYRLKVYCGKELMHDRWCEKGNIFNCPEFEEPQLSVR